MVTFTASDGSLNVYYLEQSQTIKVSPGIGQAGWDFVPKWLSATELQYQLPGGVTKTYNLPA